MRGQLIRFALLGGLNTAVTGALIALLAQVMHPQLAYTVAFLVGLSANALLTGPLVFGVSSTRAQRLTYTAWYLGTYLVGLLVLEVSGAERGSALSGLVVLVTAPLGFLGGRFVFDVRHDAPRAERNTTP